MSYLFIVKVAQLEVNAADLSGGTWRAVAGTQRSTASRQQTGASSVALLSVGAKVLEEGEAVKWGRN